MITSWTLYWILILDNIKTGLGVFLFLGAFICILFIVGTILQEIEDRKDLYKFKILLRIFTLIFLCIYILAGVIQCLLPSTKDAMIIYGVPTIVNNETIQKEFKDVYLGGKKFITVINERVIELMQSKKEEIK